GRGRTALVIRPILPAKRMQLPGAGLKERQQGRHIIKRPQPQPRIIAPARMRPGAVALLVTIGQRNDLGAPLRPPDRAERHIRRKPDLMKRHDPTFQKLRSPRARRRPIWAAIWLWLRWNPATSGVVTLMV